MAQTRWQRTVELAWYKAIAELKAESSRYYIGILWWLAEPAIYVATFYLVFAVGLRVGGDGYLAFLLSGLVCWKWFASTVQTGGNAFVSNRNLIYQVRFHKFLLVAVVVLANSIKFVILLTLLVGFLLFGDYHPNIHWFEIPLLLGNLLLVITAASTLAAVSITLFPVTKLLIDNGIMVLFFMSGIFFDITQRSEPLRSVLLINPIAAIITDLRSVLLAGNSINWTYEILVAPILALLCVASILIVGRLNSKIAKVVNS